MEHIKKQAFFDRVFPSPALFLNPLQIQGKWQAPEWDFSYPFLIGFPA
jgi:putative NADH-flavin reductase